MQNFFGYDGMPAPTYAFRYTPLDQPQWKVRVNRLLVAAWGDMNDWAKHDAVLAAETQEDFESGVEYLVSHAMEMQADFRFRRATQADQELHEADKRFYGGKSRLVAISAYAHLYLVRSGDDIMFAAVPAMTKQEHLAKVEELWPDLSPRAAMALARREHYEFLEGFYHQANKLLESINTETKGELLHVTLPGCTWPEKLNAVEGHVYYG